MAEVVWQVCWPVVFYGLMVDGASVLWGQSHLGAAAAGAALAVPFLGYWYGSMKGKFFDRDGRRRMRCGEGIFAFFLGIVLCCAVNTLIRLSPLPVLFPGFTEAAGEIYGWPFVWQAVAVGVVIPAAEELVFRGLVFGGLRRSHSFGFCACVSAAVFGWYHGNVVQGVYGVVMGLGLAWGMERKGTVAFPALMHMGANVTSVVLTALL